MAEECFAVVLSDQAPVAVFARASPDGLFDVSITQDADLVHAIAHHLIRRIPGPGQGDRAVPSRQTEEEGYDEGPVEVPVAAADSQKQGGWRGRLGKRG